MATSPSIGSSKGEEIVVKTNAFIDPAPINERANSHVSESRGGFFHWFDPNDGPVERRLVLKLDFYILTYACIGFWVHNSFLWKSCIC
jgi:hypothetical protein